MRKPLLFIWFTLLSIALQAQELNCNVVIVSDQLVGVNKKVFTTLEKAASEFMNQTKWTDKEYLPQEKIECSIVLTLTDRPGNDSYTGSIQVQSSRPVYNSVYTTPVLNYKDDDLAFSYIEFEPLQYDENNYQSELISTLSFFAYLIIAVDADTFDLYGGTPYFETCQRIIDNIKDPNNKKAWKSNTNKFNRYQLLNKITTPSLRDFRHALYTYHLKGLDVMNKDKRIGKQKMAEALISMRQLSSNNLSSQLLRIFMDAKSDEIVKAFAKGPGNIDKMTLIETLNKIAPYLANKWQDINS
ncbi:MAG: DUF4835 domain-containing protein [Flavobacteriia bacterium]|nr:MAG: DUF4835 domain-containing protein [Flavobacteriia bacterium]